MSKKVGQRVKCSRMDPRPDKKSLAIYGVLASVIGWDCWEIVILAESWWPFAVSFWGIATFGALVLGESRGWLTGA